MKSNLLVLMAMLCLTFNSQAQENEEFKPSGKLFGEVFGDYYYKMAGDTGMALTGDGEYQETEKDFNAFALRRFNLGYEYNFSKKFSGRLLLEGTDSEKLANDKRGVNVKNASLTWKDIFPGSSLTIGGQPTITYALTDKTWGYRSLEKDITDFRGYSSSNDWGILLNGSILKDEILSYAIMLGNGTAQKKENDRYKKLYAALTSKLMDKKLLVDLYFDYEPVSESANMSMVKAFIGYQVEMFTIGVEPFLFFDNESDTKPMGIELFGKVKASENINIYARTDIFNPDMETDNAGDNEIFAIFGCEYSPAKNISLMPNIWMNMYNPKSDSDYQRKSDIVPRITFRYKF